MTINPERAAPLLFWTLLTVEVIRQRSFWITVLGDSWPDQLVAIGSAAAFSGSQWYLAHFLTKASRKLLEDPLSTTRETISRLIVLAPMAFAWTLQIASVGTTAALDIAMRLGHHQTPTDLLLATGLSNQHATIFLSTWSILVTSALLAGLTAIGIQTADSQRDQESRGNLQRQLDLQHMTDERNRYQDLYNLLRTPIARDRLPEPEAEKTATVAPADPSSSISSEASSIGSEASSIGSEAPSIGSEAPSIGSEAPSIGSEASSTDSDSELLDLQCPYCSWRTGPREKKSARLSLNGHKGGKHKGRALVSQPEPVPTT